jgi:Rps23 Pro-64 3,4-dihydroxylase Tpa1-like proline 4-hydroxylase
MEYIYEAHDIVPRTLCEEIIEKFENDPNKSIGVMNGGVCTKLKNSIDLPMVDNHPEWESTVKKLKEYVYLGMSKYFEHLNKNVLRNKEYLIVSPFYNGTMTTLQVQKYETGGHYVWHSDNKLGRSRLLAILIYLNDIDDESGGCTEFINGKIIKPHTGKIVFFPATWTYPHRGQKVEKGVKYIVSGFVDE